MSKSKDVLQNLAKIASSAYFGKNKVPLQESLQKIAQAEELTTDQVMYVTAEANKDVWAQLFKLNKEASYNFKPVDPKSLIKELQVKEASAVSAQSLDYLSAPGHKKEAAADGASIEGYFSRGDDVDNASKRAELKHALNYKIEKMAFAKDQLETDLIILRSQAAKLEADVIKEAHQMVIREDYGMRGQALETVAEFMRGACENNVELGQRLMSKLSFVLKRQGLVKEADLKAPAEYISETLPARIVNGNHSLYITIDLLAKKEREISDVNRQWLIVDNSLPELKEKIREL